MADLPISEVLFSRMLRSEPAEVRELASGLPDNRRAQLALFCYARTHLRDVGLLIARECSRFSLTREGGHAGSFLSDQALSAVPEPALSPSPRRPAVSLSRPAPGLRRLPPQDAPEMAQ